MAVAKRDDNSVPTFIGLLNTDGSTITRLQSDPNSHTILLQDGTGGTDNGSNPVKDDNRVPIAFATSKDDGTTPVAIYINSSGKILADST